MLNRIMAVSPWVEVAIRTAYWRLPSARALMTRMQNRRARTPEAPVPRESLPLLIDAIRALGVGAGDILIVHSDLDLLRRFPVRPAELNAALIELLGPDGTLVMPAYPIFAEEPKGQDRLTADVSGLVLRYDPRRTPIWTGLLPHALMRTAGARRSALPINSLVALGRHAEAMFATELDGECPLPCGRQSAWFYCLEHGAKILGLGLDLPHSLTMNHVAEDAYAEQWPVPDWYRDRRFEIVLSDGRSIEKCVRERHPRWAMNYAERTLARELREAGIFRDAEIAGIRLEYLEAREHVAFLNARKARHYPYYIFPFQR